MVTIMQPTDTRDFEAFYGLLASKTPGTLPVTIPETIFFNGDGCPVARYFYSAAEERVVAVKVLDENTGPTVDVASGWARESLESGGPVAVARYRTGARTLTAGELAKMLAVVTDRFVNPNAAAAAAAAAADDDASAGGRSSPRVPSGRATQPAVAIPLVLQRYVAPGEGGARHVTTFMMAGTSVMCETFQCAYHDAYTPRHAASGSVASAELWELGDGPGVEAGLLSAAAQLASTSTSTATAASAAATNTTEQQQEGAAAEDAAAAAADAAAPLLGIAWEPAAPPAKELYLRQTLLKLLNGLRREQGVQILGVIAELILPAAAAADAEDNRANDQGTTSTSTSHHSPAPVLPVLTGAFGVCWSGEEARVAVGAADGESQPFYTALPALSATSAGVGGLPTGAGVVGAAVPTRPAGFVPEYEESSTAVAAAAAAASAETPSPPAAAAAAAVETGVAVPARGKNPNPKPQPRGSAGPPSPAAARSAQRPGTAPEGGTSHRSRSGGGGGGGGAGAGVAARRQFEAEYVLTQTAGADFFGGGGGGGGGGGVERVNDSAPLVGGSGSLGAYANNDPGTSSFRSPRTGRVPASERYGVHSPAAQMLMQTSSSSAASSPGGGRGRLHHTHHQTNRRRPGTASGNFFFASASAGGSLGPPSPNRGGGGGGGGGYIHNTHPSQMDTTTKGHSEAKVWARGVPHSSEADEALRASASTLLQSGRARLALDGPLANETRSRRDKVAVPMMTQLSRRLEEMRGALASELETNAALQLERIGSKDTAGRLMAAARDAEEGLMSATRAFERERSEALEAKAAAAAEARRRDEEIQDLKRRLDEAMAERDYLRERVNGERDEMLGVQGELQRALGEERTALAEARAQRDLIERENSAELKQLRTECANLKITNEAVLRDTRRLGEEATALRMDNLRLSNYHDKMTRMGMYQGKTGGGGDGGEGMQDEGFNNLGGYEGEDDKSRQRRLNRQHLKPDELSDLLDDANERYLESRLVNRTLANNLEVLKQIFYHYASSERAGGERGNKLVSPRELVTLVRDCKLLEAGVGGSKLTATAVDQIFVKVNYDRKKGKKGDTVMDFHEFINALVHIAAMKFVKETSLAARLDALMLEYLLPNAKRNTFYRTDFEEKKGPKKPGMKSTKAIKV